MGLPTLGAPRGGAAHGGRRAGGAKAGPAPGVRCGAAAGGHRPFARFSAARAPGGCAMPAVYKYPPHPLCPGIQFKQLNPYLEDERPPCPEHLPHKDPPSPREGAIVSPLPMRDDPLAHHGGAAAAAHHEAAARASCGHSSVSFEKPHKESRRQRERELNALEIKIPYSMARVPECTITSSGIHVSAAGARVHVACAVRLPVKMRCCAVRGSAS